MRERWYDSERGDDLAVGALVMGSTAVMAVFGYLTYEQYVVACYAQLPESYFEELPEGVSTKSEDYKYRVKFTDVNGRNLSVDTNERPEVEAVGSAAWTLTMKGVWFGPGDACDKNDLGVKKAYLPEWKSPPVKNYLFIERPSI